MKRLILTLLVFQSSLYSTHNETKAGFTTQQIIAATSIVVMPIVALHLYQWWQERKLYALNDTDFIHEIQSQLEQRYTPFKEACSTLTQRDETQSNEDAALLTDEIKNYIIAFDTSTPYRFTAYCNAVQASLDHLNRMEQLVQERIEQALVLNDNVIKNMLITTRTDINQATTRLTQLHNFVITLDEYYSDRFDLSEDETDYEPTYL